MPTIFTLIISNLLVAIAFFFVTTVNNRAQAQTKVQAASITVLPLKKEYERKALWTTLATLENTPNLVISSNENIVEAIRAKCGSAPPDLIKQLIQMNPGEPKISPATRSLRFIACPYWYFGPKGNGVSINVRKGESLKNLAKLLLKTDGPETLNKIRELNIELFDRNDNIIRNSKIIVPYTIRPIQVFLHKDSTQPLSLILAALPDKAKKQALNTGIPLGPGEYQLAAIDSVEIEDPMTDCGISYTANRWPYDLETIEKTIKKARLSLQVSPPSSLIVVADTGVSLSDPNIRQSLWDNPNVKNGFSHNFNYRNDRHGASMVTRRGDNADVEPPPSDYRFHNHGSDVARIIAESGRLLYPLTQTVIAKINDPQPPYRIGVDTIPTSIAYARVVGADVVNISVLIGAPSESLKSAIQNSSALIVAAAGNAGRQVEGLSIYPPGLSEGRERLLVVGSHNWDEQITHFTNIGSRVDILAQGCAIPVIDSDGKRRLVSGTSFSAPFVSQTAAELIAVGVPSNPLILRNRLLATGKFIPELEGMTKYGVILDPERSLRVKEDSIWLKGSKRPLFGQLETSQSWVCISANSAESYSPATVLKIINSGANNELTIWKLSEDEGAFETAQCRNGFSEVVVFRAEDQVDFINYAWEEILDVVPKLH